MIRLVIASRRAEADKRNSSEESLVISELLQVRVLFCGALSFIQVRFDWTTSAFTRQLLHSIEKLTNVQAAQAHAYARASGEKVAVGAGVEFVDGDAYAQCDAVARVVIQPQAVRQRQMAAPHSF